MGAIIDVVCDAYAVDLEALSAPGRHQPLAEARAVAAWLVRQSPALQLKELGESLHRDLSGLSQAARRIEQRAFDEAVWREGLDNFKNLVSNSVSQA